METSAFKEDETYLRGNFGSKIGQGNFFPINDRKMIWAVTHKAWIILFHHFILLFLTMPDKIEFKNYYFSTLLQTRGWGIGDRVKKY